jgi:hypothetical protein
MPLSSDKDASTEKRRSQRGILKYQLYPTVGKNRVFSPTASSPKALLRIPKSQKSTSSNRKGTRASKRGKPKSNLDALMPAGTCLQCTICPKCSVFANHTHCIACGDCVPIPRSDTSKSGTSKSKSGAPKSNPGTPKSARGTPKASEDVFAFTVSSSDEEKTVDDPPPPTYARYTRAQANLASTARIDTMKRIVQRFTEAPDPRLFRWRDNSCHFDTLVFLLLLTFNWPMAGITQWLHRYMTNYTKRPLGVFVDFLFTQSGAPQVQVWDLRTAVHTNTFW